MNPPPAPVLVTLGRGRDKPQGIPAQLAQPYPQGLYELLRKQPVQVERWWSPNVWENDYRNAAKWISAIAVAVDLDFEIDDSFPDPAVVKRVIRAAHAGQIPGSILHTTPHGLRVIFVYWAPCTIRDLHVLAAKGAAAITSAALAELGVICYRVDGVTWDTARLFYTHNAEAKGVKRTDELIFMRAEAFEVDPLAAEAPPEPIAPQSELPAPRQNVIDFQGSIQQRIDKWVADNSPRYPVKLEPCPVCCQPGGCACYKQMPGDPLRWFCFCSDHTGVGVQGKHGWHGDAMDLEMHRTGLDRVAILRRDRYLDPPKPLPAPKPELLEELGKPIPIRPPDTNVRTTRAWRARSYLTCVSLLRDNPRDILGPNAKLELNTLTARVELDRKPITDATVHLVRSRIELLHASGEDKFGNVKGMVQNAADLFAAAEQIATENSYNPIREYLTALTWDGVERIAHIPEEILSADDNQINREIIRRWMISAVARAMQPGCKVDTMLILVGRQGVRKSTFFRVLAGDAYFSDTAVDIRHKDSFAVLQGIWIYEWAELEALNRARDAQAANAFITSASDRFRPSHARLVIDSPRTCVLGGTTNKRQFLDDETGARRFWPIIVGDVRIERLTEQRDQLWAEAMTYYEAGEQCWLSKEGEAQLIEAQVGHEIEDPWSQRVLNQDYIIAERTTAWILEKAIGKDPALHSRADQMRISKILRSAGYESFRMHRGGRFWRIPWSK